MRLSIGIICMLFSTSLFGQESYIIKGLVTNILDDSPMVGATVNLNFGEKTTFVDAEGRFELKTSEEIANISVRFVGFVPFSKRYFLPIKEDLVIKMSQVENELEEVIVSSVGSEAIKRPVLGVSTLSIRAIEKLPMALGEVDILKGLQMLPGISSVGEASNGVNVRGGTTDQNLMLLDDAPIWNPTHMFGLFSAFPSDAISSFDLYKGNVPSRYGGRAAAVLDVKLANPNLSEFKMKGGVSLVANKLKMDIPIIKDKLALMVSGRGSFNDFLLPVISDELQDLKARFGDGAAKLFYRINDKQTLSLSTYYSYDFFQTEQLGTIGNISADATQFEYSTLNFSGKWFVALSDKANIQTTVVSSYYQPSTLLPESNTDNTIEIRQSVNYKQAKSNLNLYLGKHNIEVGVDAINYSINPGNILPGGSESVLPIETPIEEGLELAISVEDVIEINQRTNLSLGLRYSHFLGLGASEVRTYAEGLPRGPQTVIETANFANGEVAQTYGGLEPRAGLSFSINDKNSIKLGYNLARQYLQIVSNTTTPIPNSRWKLSDANIRPQVSQLLSLGYYKDMSKSIYELSVEGYFRRTDNIIDYKPGAEFLLNQTPETEILQGINNSYGAEFMISKKKGLLTGWMNYTYARSLNRVNTGPAIEQQVNFGNWYAADFDRPHTFNTAIVIDQGKNHDFSFNFTYSTGRPFTSPQGYISYQDQTLPFYFNRNNIRLPAYHRLDFAWNIYNPRMLNKKFKGNFAFSIYNLYGRSNAYSIFFRSENGQAVPYQLTIFGTPIPSLSYNFTFD